MKHIYKENLKKRRKASRQQRRDDLACGRPRRLDLIFNLFRTVYKTDKSIALACGITPQAIGYYRMNDDISLSIAQRMFSKMGYHLTFAYEELTHPVRSPQQPSAKVRFHFPATQMPERKSRIQQIADSGRISFVAQAVLSSGRSLRSFCTFHGLNYDQIYNALRIDDIHLSLAIKIGDAIGHPFTFHVFRE